MCDRLETELKLREEGDAPNSDSATKIGIQNTD